jgi:D-lactate dehydrogenase (quinone)
MAEATTLADPIPDRREVLARLTAIVGHKFVITQPDATRAYCTGYRADGGPCLAVVRPGALIELWRCLEACVEARVIVILQAANTGLTGGSTPAHGYDREVVVVNTLRLNGVKVLDQGKQVVCLPGATLYGLERALKPYGREPHSVIGSSCIGASVIGGVCNSSGGALVRRGPAYTELSLFARLTEAGRLELVNHLGIDLGNDPEHMLRNFEDPNQDLNRRARVSDGCASDRDYEQHVRGVDEETPARFNADPRRLFEASGSAGKVAIFAVRLDTFALEPATATFYIGTNDPNELTALRRDMLQSAAPLPIAAEYMHREAFDIAARYGKDMYLAIQFLGADRLPWLYRLKAQVDAIARRTHVLPSSDHLLQALSRIVPPLLPRRIKRMGGEYEHQLLLKVGADAIEQTRERLARTFPSDTGGFIECTDNEAASAFLHRFVTAGAAIRYHAVHGDRVEGILALDVALKRSERNWAESLPEHMASRLAGKVYYGHFFCHVFHRDYLVRKGCDMASLKRELCTLLDAQGAEYPAEHNVGHLYQAKPPLRRHYRELDPRNAFNPGIGGLSKNEFWLEEATAGDPRGQGR